jgi:hypothetical protein
MQSALQYWYGVSLMCNTSPSKSCTPMPRRNVLSRSNRFRQYGTTATLMRRSMLGSVRNLQSDGRTIQPQCTNGKCDGNWHCGASRNHASSCLKELTYCEHTLHTYAADFQTHAIPCTQSKVHPSHKREFRHTGRHTPRRREHATPFPLQA